MATDVSENRETFEAESSSVIVNTHIDYSNKNGVTTTYGVTNASNSSRTKGMNIKG